MKITTWNINGYRAVMKKGFADWLRQDDSEIICLQEVKARPDQIEAAGRTWDGYETYWNPAVRPGYSGVAVFTRTAPLEVGFG
jgi:exodeoxyribonuclease-3